MPYFYSEKQRIARSEAMKQYWSEIHRFTREEGISFREARPRWTEAHAVMKEYDIEFENARAFLKWHELTPDVPYRVAMEHSIDRHVYYVAGTIGGKKFGTSVTSDTPLTENEVLVDAMQSLAEHMEEYGDSGEPDEMFIEEKSVDVQMAW